MSEVRLYFAYGSNINPKEMKRKCPTAHKVSIAKLPEHQLDFYGHSTVWDGGTESVTPSASSAVWGVLYQLNAGTWDTLDGYEDARFDGTGAYFHYSVEVLDDKGQLIPATIYKKAELRTPQLPSAEYLSVICKGAEHHDFPADYITFLKGLPSKPASYPVPRQPKGRHLICADDDCSSCSGGCE